MAGARHGSTSVAAGTSVALVRRRGRLGGLFCFRVVACRQKQPGNDGGGSGYDPLVRVHGLTLSMMM